MTAKHMNSIWLGMILAVAGSVPAAAQANRPVTEVKLEYQCEIPRQLPLQLKLEDKERRQTQVDAHDIYRTGHKQGWYWVVHGYITSGGKFPKKPVSVQEWAIESTARDIGVQEAKAAILKLQLTHDQDVVVTALKKQYPQWDDDTFPQPVERRGEEAKGPQGEKR